MADRSVRSLVHLQRQASTARTFNLHAVWRKHAHTGEHSRSPFFQCSILNRSIILKHRLRRNEVDLFAGKRRVATKVILPIDRADLQVGGQFFFVGQIGYRQLLREVVSRRGEAADRDERLLDILDSLPSLDPFLTRERIRKDGFVPARCYFDISEADTARMYDFLRAEIEPLIGASFGDLDVAINHKTAKFVNKILHDSTDAEMEPLRLSLGMSQLQFDEGVFSWKGFIYYKWALNQLLPRVRPVADHIAAIRWVDHMTPEARLYVSEVRPTLQRAIAEACRTVNASLGVYDRAFNDLARNGQPRAFREFLLQAPAMFYALGERLGAVDHIVSFWRFRFPEGKDSTVTAEELVDILKDFEASLDLTPTGTQSGLAADAGAAAVDVLLAAGA